MSRKGLSQETLKCIACVTMLVDHIGATVVYALAQNAEELGGVYQMMRIVGRLSFPIYCFLLAEGAHYTRNPRKYALRLAIAAVLSELPFDYAFRGGLDWQHQNVMFTLLLGFVMLRIMGKCPDFPRKLLASIPFLLLAGWIKCDYGMNGVLAILMFGLTRELRYRRVLQFFGLWFLFSPSHTMLLSWLSGAQITTQEWALLAMLPISLYSGRKATASRCLQWGVYLFYPVHLIILLGVCAYV